MDENSNGAMTQPTLETILERINSLGDNLSGELGELRGQFADLRGHFDELRGQFTDLRGEFGELRIEVANHRNEFQLYRGEMEIRLDRIEGMTNQTRAEMLNLRADFRESRST